MRQRACMCMCAVIGGSGVDVSDCAPSCRSRVLLGCKSKLTALLTSPSR